MRWMAIVSEVINRIPVERLLSRTPDSKKRLEELQEILGGAEPKRTRETETKVEEKPPRRVHLEPRKSGVSTEETVAYQNREMVKVMRTMAKHCAQKFRIFNKPCDCGQRRHILEIEDLAEDTIQMVDNPDVYYRIIEVGKELEPKVTLNAIGSGRYDDEYPKYAKVYRELCKELDFGDLELDSLEKPEPGKYFPEEVRANE